MKFIVYLLTLFMVGTAVAQNPTILQGNYISNVFGQSNFVLNPNAQTNTANVTNATRPSPAVTPLVATSEFNLSLTNGQFATWTLRAFDQGMKGQNCEARFTYRGFATATTKAELVQNSLVVASLTLTASTDPRIASINFPCGDLTNLTTFRIAQTTANMTGTNEIGGIYVGLATNQANVAQAEYMGGFSTSSLLSTVTGTAAYWTNFTNTSGSVTAEGKASSASNTLAATFGAMPAGEYQVVVSVPFFMFGGTGGHSCRLAVKEETSGQIQVISTMGTASAGAGLYVGVSATGPAKFSFTGAATSRTFRIVAANTGWTTSANGTCYTDSSYTGNLAVYRFPTSSELVVTPERQNTFAGIKGVASGGSNVVTSASWTKLTSASTMTRTVFGKAKVETNNDYSITIENLPVGSYYITASGLFYAQAAVSGATTECFYGIADTATGGAQIGGLQANSTGDATLTNQTIINSTMGGIYTNTSVANKTFFIQALRAGGTGSCNAFNTSDRPLTISVIPLDQPSNSALYVQGPILGAQTGAAIPSGYLGKAEFGGGNGSTSTSPSNVYTISNVTPGVYMVRGYAAAQATGARSATYAGYGCTITSNASLSLNWYDFLNIPQSYFGASGGTFSGFALSNNYANSSASIMQIVNVTSTTTYYVRCAIDTNGSGVVVVAGAEFVRLN